MRFCLLFSVVLVACAPPEEQPIIDPNAADYDEAFEFMSPGLRDLGVETPLGSLAGTFAMRAVSATIVETGIAGQQRGGGVNFVLIERTFNDETLEYSQSSKLCTGFNFEVAGVETSPPPSTYGLVPASPVERSRAEEARGVYLESGHIQLWGLRDLPDPYETALPADRAEAAESPHVERIFDMEDDGNPGMTLKVSGLVAGEVYAAQRKLVEMLGVALSADLVTGWTFTTYDSVILGADNPAFDAADPSAASAHPDNDESWFEQRRIDDGSSCDDVIALSEDDVFNEVPMWRQ